MEAAKTKRHFKHWQTVLDLATMSMGVLAVCLGIFIFLNLETQMNWMPIMFLLAALVDMISGMKAFYYGRRLAGLGICSLAVLVFGFAVISYIVIWI